MRQRWLPCYIIIVCSSSGGGGGERRSEGNIPTERIGHAQEGRKEGGVLAVPRRARLTRFLETDFESETLMVSFHVPALERALIPPCDNASA